MVKSSGANRTETLVVTHWHADIADRHSNDNKQVYYTIVVRRSNVRSHAECLSDRHSNPLQKPLHTKEFHPTLIVLSSAYETFGQTLT